MTWSINSILFLSALFLGAMAAHMFEEFVLKLSGQLGEPYRAHQQRTSRLFPGFW